MKNAWWILTKYPVMKYYKIGKRFSKDPELAKEEYLKVLKSDMMKLKELKERGYSKEEGLQKYAEKLLQSLMESMNLPPRNP